MAVRQTVEKRFWSKVAIGGSTECWEWQGAVCRSNKRHRSFYGTFWDGEKTGGVHRFSYRIAKGEIPTGLLIRHRCDNGLCVNPDHLEIGTQLDNMRDVRERNPIQRLRGGNHPSSTLSDEQVAEIKRMLRRRIRRKFIAGKFGTSLNIIGFIARGQTWRSVP